MNAMTQAAAAPCWATVKAAFDSARAAELRHDAEFVDPFITVEQVGPERSAQVDGIPRAVWEKSQALTEARCDAEEAWIAFPSPDLASVIEKIDYARPRWAAFDDWPDDWWRAIEADLRRIATGDPHMGWLRDRDALLGVANTTKDLSDDRCTEIVQASLVFDDLILNTPATTSDGILAKALIIVGGAAGHCNPDGAAERVFSEAKAFGLMEWEA